MVEDEEVIMDESDGDVEEQNNISSISRHRKPTRSSSISTPPPPPADFNPPADTPIDVVESVSPPIGAFSPPSPPSVPQSGSGLSISQQISGSDHDVSIAAAAAIASGSSARPQLKAFQRVSTDSIDSPQSAGSAFSEGSNTSTLSEGGEHLIEAREVLLYSGESSRRDSSSTSTTERPARGSFEWNVIAPTPPSKPVGLDVEQPEAGPSQPRRVAPSPPPPADEEGHDMPAEHAWDSVWPAPGSTHRNPFVSDLSRPHFPTAPMSPYVTPAFSPAIIPTTSIPRKPPSPSMSPSDPISPSRQQSSHRVSPRDTRDSPILGTTGALEEYNLRRRGSITATAPLLAHSPPKSQPVSISGGKHQRSFSASSPTFAQKSYPYRDSLERGQSTPPESPPSSPRRSASLSKSKSSDHSPVALVEPSFKKKSQAAPPLKTGQERLADISSSPDFSALPEGLIAKSGRPRGRSLSSLESSPAMPSPAGAFDAEAVQAEAEASRPPILPSISSSSLPPIALPLPAPTAVALPTLAGDDGLPPAILPLMTAYHSAPAPPSPLFAPLSRPAIMRRALSDYDTNKHRVAAPPLYRSLSITAELDKSPKRSTTEANIVSPTSPRLGGDADSSRIRKSPRRSPSALPSLTPLSIGNLNEHNNLAPLSDIPALDSTEIPGTPFVGDGGIDAPTHIGEVNLVDEGDLLPNLDFQMDVTFDDEGLNTLERIFLLSKSEFPFHRAYVARVLGDLLVEVDPCESVEYVLPLLSGFSMDEDESVKEAFASEMHRILWYFYSACRLISEEAEHMEEEIAGMGVEAGTETITVTSHGLDKIDKPTADELASVPDIAIRRSSIASGPSTDASTTLVNPSTAGDMDIDTPGTAVSDQPSSHGTAFSPQPFVNPYADDVDPEKGWAKDVGPLIERPALVVNFFTPLLGSLLLNQNPTISESIRNGLVQIIGRLRYKNEPTLEVWGSAAMQKEADERRTFASQNGPHAHDLRPFDRDSRKMVEMELITGIILGMGQLSIEMPEGLFGDTLEDGQQILEDYAQGNSGGGSEMQNAQAELFQEQLIAEATAGRATSMNLIGSLCEYYAGDEAVQYGFVDEVLRSGDGDVSVRAEGAVALSCLLKIVPVEQVYEVIPLFEQYMEDPTDHVRQSVCLSLPAITKRIEEQDYRREFSVKAVNTLFQSGEDVRCAILEMLGEVIYVFDDDPDGPPPELLEVYTQDVTNQPINDGDWDVIAAFNFPGVALTLGSKRWSELRNLYQRLQDRAGDKIMRILAASLHELAKILTFDQVEQDLLPVYKRCLICNDEIRERVYEHVDVLVTRLRPDVAWELFTNLAKSWKDGTLGGWRAREQLALHLPSFLETFSDIYQGEQVLEVLRDALLDPFAAVRDGVTKGIPPAYVILGDDSPVAVKFRHMLLDLGMSSQYRRRLTFVRCLREFIKPPPNQHAFEAFFVPSLPRLSTDVVDIRLGLAQAIADLFVVGAYYGEDTGNVPSEIKNLAQILHDDSSAEVRDTLRNVDLKHMHKGKGVPHEVTPTPKPDRALRSDLPPTNKEGSSNHVQTTKKDDVDSQVPEGEKGEGGLPAAPNRRPSSEVAEKMDTMRLGSATSNDRPSLDPFSESFAEATTPTMNSRN